jgi:hypothetical protein
MRLAATGECLLVGAFLWGRLEIAVGGARLAWPLALPFRLQVRPLRGSLSFNMRTPCFLSPGATQGAVFVIDGADSTITELLLSFTMAGLREVRHYGGSSTGGQ